MAAQLLRSVGPTEPFAETNSEAWASVSV